MNLLASNEAIEENSSEFHHRFVDTPSQRWESWWVWLSERVNPIVIKEARQAFNSRQFSFSFGLTLIAVMAWTLIAILMQMPRLYYVPAGPQLLAGYLVILAFPLLIFVPFGAYRSLMIEAEDRTFELLSISALSAMQIVQGKMASALLQILVYVSALAPCIVVTFLLRGVSLGVILLLLGVTVLISVCETATALLLASIGRSRFFQVGSAIVTLIVLLFLFFYWCGLLTVMLLEESLSFVPSIDQLVPIAIGWLSSLAIAIPLCLRAAAASIDFPSENHAFSIRVRILLLTCVTLFWALWASAASESSDFVQIYLAIFFVFWLFLGGLVTGEKGILSPRTQRTLPQTLAGRVFLTWFYPGAGLGFIFLTTLIAAVALTLAGFELFCGEWGITLRNRTSFGLLAYCMLCYFVIYVGTVRLLMAVVPRVAAARMAISTLSLILLLAMGHLVPLMIAFALHNFAPFPYDWHQCLNIVWTLEESTFPVSANIGPTIGLLTLFGLGIFGLNLLLCSRDVLLVRVAVPPRLQEELDKDRPAPSPPPDPFA